MDEPVVALDDVDVAAGVADREEDAEVGGGESRGV